RLCAEETRLPGGLSPLELCVHIHFEIRLRNNLERYSQSAAGAVFKKHVLTIYPQQAAAEIALPIERLARPHFGQTAGETIVVLQLIQPSLDTWRRNLQRVRGVYEILDI